MSGDERNFSNAEPATIWGLMLQQVPVEPDAPRFVSFVSDLIGVESLVPNPSLDGGFHQTTTGGFLDVQSKGKGLAFGDRYFQRRRGGP